MEELIHLDRDAELWGGSKLTQRLISILQDLVRRLKGKKLTSFFYSDYSLFKTNSLDVDFSNAAAIIQILVDRLFKKLPEYVCLKRLLKENRPRLNDNLSKEEVNYFFVLWIAPNLLWL